MKFSILYFLWQLRLLLIRIVLIRMNTIVAILRFQGPPFTYRYGFSFLLYVSGFITTEVAGTYAIFLYISWHQKELVRRDSRRKNYGVGSISFFSYNFIRHALRFYHRCLEKTWTELTSLSKLSFGQFEFIYLSLAEYQSGQIIQCMQIRISF